MMSLDQVSIEDFIDKEGKCQEVRPTYGTKHQTLLPPLNNGTKYKTLPPLLTLQRKTLPQQNEHDPTYQPFPQYKPLPKPN